MATRPLARAIVALSALVCGAGFRAQHGEVEARAATAVGGAAGRGQALAEDGIRGRFCALVMSLAAASSPGAALLVEKPSLGGPRGRGPPTSGIPGGFDAVVLGAAAGPEGVEREWAGQRDQMNYPVMKTVGIPEFWEMQQMQHGDRAVGATADMGTLFKGRWQPGARPPAQRRQWQHAVASTQETAPFTSNDAQGQQPAFTVGQMHMGADRPPATAPPGVRVSDAEALGWSQYTSSAEPPQYEAYADEMPPMESKSSYVAYAPARDGAPPGVGPPHFSAGMPPPAALRVYSADSSAGVLPPTASRVRSTDQAGSAQPGGGVQDAPEFRKSSYVAYRPPKRGLPPDGAPPRHAGSSVSTHAADVKGVPDSMHSYYAEEDWTPRVDGVTILRELGHGGFGTVWLGWQGEKEVAVKGFGMTELDKIRREVSISMFFGKFTNNFLWVGGWHWDKRIPPAGEERPSYMIQELAVGDMHKDVVVKSFAEVPLRTRLAYAAQALEALAVMAEHGFVHRDVKPDNLLLVRDGRTFRVKLADFGLACVADNRKEDYDPALGRFNTDMRGVIPYIAPEGFATQMTPESDVYSMSLVIYQLLFQDLPPLLTAAHSVFIGPEESRIREVIAMCKGFSFDRDGYIIALAEASRSAGIASLQNLIRVMMNMQTFVASARMDAKSAARSLYSIAESGIDAEWAAAEAVVERAKEEAFLMCQEEADMR